MYPDHLLVSVIVCLLGVIGIFVSVYYFPRKFAFITCAGALVVTLCAGYYSRKMDREFTRQQFPDRLETFMMLYDGEEVSYERWQRVMHVTNSLESLKPFARALGGGPERLQATLQNIEIVVRLKTNAVQAAHLK